MNYIQISVPLPTTENDTEIVIAKLSFIGFESFEEQTDSLIAYIPEKDFVKDELLGLDYYFKCDRQGKLDVELIPDKNWNEVWESNYPPVTIADCCFVRAPFHDSIPNMDYEITIIPKMAFGTAHHETTSLMLELILSNDFTNLNVLDMGCGSGVLAILASMRGAASITAIDTDIWSYKNTLENVKVNDISNVKVIEGGVEFVNKIDNYNIILANINKNILLRDMKHYAAALLVNGYIYFSGFYFEDLSDIEAEANKYGLKLENYLEKNNWIAAVFRKNI